MNNRSRLWTLVSNGDQQVVSTNAVAEVAEGFGILPVVFEVCQNRGQCRADVFQGDFVLEDVR
jgi:hypothetical protein